MTEMNWNVIMIEEDEDKCANCPFRNHCEADGAFCLEINLKEYLTND